MIIAKVILTAWILLGMLVYASNNGKPKDGTYKLSDAVVASIIIFGLLILGGFYK